MSISLGEKDYRRGASQRIREAWILIKREELGGGIYLAGRAVEGMLRALIWKNDIDIRMGRKSLDTGHDLRQLLGRVTSLGILADYEHHHQLAREVQYVGRLWSNNLRFFPVEKVKAHWWDIGILSQRYAFKRAVHDYYLSCLSVVKRCEVLCED